MFRQCIRTSKRNKSYKNWKGKRYQSVTIQKDNDKNPKISTGKLLKLTGKVIKFPEYKINIFKNQALKKLIVFLYSRKKKLDATSYSSRKRIKSIEIKLRCA